MQLQTKAAVISKTIESRNQDEKFEIISKMIRSAYIEAKLNIPFMNHERIVKLQEMNGISMGTLHRNRRSLKRMIFHISYYMYLKLKQSLIQNAKTFSVIFDTTTDIKGEHYLIVYIQSLEIDKDISNQITQVRPVVYFYKLIKLGIREDAQALFNAVIRAIQADHGDGFEWLPYFTNKLIAVPSDGEAVMLGKDNGLARKLEDYV